MRAKIYCEFEHQIWCEFKLRVLHLHGRSFGTCIAEGKAVKVI